MDPYLLLETLKRRTGLDQAHVRVLAGLGGR